MFTTRDRRLLTLATLAGAAGTLLPVAPAQAAADTAPPVVTVTVRDADRLGWHRLATVPVTVQVRDVGSGVDFYSSQVVMSGAQSGSVAIEEASTRIDVSSQGATALAYDVYDMEGNHRQGSVVVRLDNTAPSATLTGLPAGGFVRQGSAVTVAAACSDAHSGVEGCQVSTGTTLDTGTLGEHRIEYFAQDVAGNSELEWATYTVVGDASGPVTAFTPRRSPNANGWFDRPVVVDANATSPYGGSVASLTHAVNAVQGPIAQGPSAAIQVTAEGQTSVQARATDSLGINGPLVTTEVKVDSVDPTIDLAPVGPVTVGQTVTIPFACQDATSGTASCQIDGKRMLPGGVLDTSVPGTSTVRVYTVDNASNEATRSIEVVVDPAPGTGPGNGPGTGQGGSTTKAPTTGKAAYAVKQNGRGTATVRITSETGTPTGVVEVYDGKRLIGTAQLRADGTAVVRLKKLAKGKHVLTTRYLGSDTALPVTTPKKKIRVR